jgi:hypothetical protein
MQRMYFCPNCRAPVAYGYRFCSSFGVKLEWLTQEMTPKSSSLDQSLVGREQNQYQQCHTGGNRDAVTQQKNQQIGSATAPIRTEILKLLTELLDKQIKYN